jgi:hypothetical protein
MEPQRYRMLGLVYRGSETTLMPIGCEAVSLGRNSSDWAVSEPSTSIRQ